MRLLLTYLALSLFLAINYSTPGYTESQSIQPELEIQPEDNNQYSITGLCTSATKANLEYRLIIDKQGKSGRAKTRQGGKFHTEEGTRVQLSTTQISLLQGEQARISLTIYNKGELIAEKTNEIGSL